MNATLGQNQRTLAAIESSRPTADFLLARVCRVDRNVLLVAAFDDGTIRHIPRDENAWATGDWIWHSNDGKVLIGVPRFSELTRSRGDGSVQVLASNVDHVFLTVPAPLATRESVLERLALIGWDSGAIPHFIVTKRDLVDPDQIRAVERAITSSTPGVSWTFVSTVDGGGVEEVRTALTQPSTAVFIGQSGVGKSSIINALSDGYVQETAAVRERDLKGRHTTTSREIFPIPGTPSVVIDTPGIRELGTPADATSIDDVFTEIGELAMRCKFSDCTHTGDAGCAIADATAVGAVSEERVERYLRLQREAAHVARRAEPGRRDKTTEYTRFAREFRRARGDG